VASKYDHSIRSTCVSEVTTKQISIAVALDICSYKINADVLCPITFHTVTSAVETALINKLRISQS